MLLVNSSHIKNIFQIIIKNDVPLEEFGSTFPITLTMLLKTSPFCYRKKNVVLILASENIW